MMYKIGIVINAILLIQLMVLKHRFDRKVITDEDFIRIVKELKEEDVYAREKTDEELLEILRNSENVGSYGLSILIIILAISLGFLLTMV